MTKLAFLTCEDLSSYVHDDQHFFDDLSKHWPELQYDLVPWSSADTDWRSYNHAIIRTTWDYTQRLPEFLKTLELIENQGCRISNSLETIRWNSNKIYLSELRSRGIAIVESYFLGEVDLRTLQTQLSPDLKYVLKPIVGASADRIEILDKDRMLNRITQLPDLHNWFLQPFMEEILSGELSFFYFSGQFSHACIKKPKGGDFRVQEEHGGLISPYQPQVSDLNFANQVIALIEPLPLYGRVDFISTAEGPRLMELELIEPSMYFKHHPQAGANFIRALKNHLSN